MLVDRRKMAVTKSYEASSIGRNFKGIDEELVDKNKEEIQVDSDVTITGGTHKGLTGKVVAVQRQKTAGSREAAFRMAAKD